MVRPSSAELTAADLIIEALERFGDREAFVLGAQRLSYAHAAAAIRQTAQKAIIAQKPRLSSGRRP